MNVETVIALVFLAIPAALTIVTMLLAGSQGGSSSWLAVIGFGLASLVLAFPVGFTLAGPLVGSPAGILLVLILFGIIVGALGHRLTRKASHG